MASQLRVDSIESSVGSSVGIGTTGGTVTINGSVNISGGSVANVALTPSSLSINGNAYPSVGPLSNRNLIINGAMQVAQRGTSSTGQTTTGYKAVDRFATGIATAGTWTITQSTDAPAGFSNSIKYDCTTSNASLDSTSELWITQRIEAQNLQHLNYGTADAQDCTFSFYFKTNKTGVYTVEIFQADSDRTVGFELNVTQTGWQKYSFVIPGDTAGTINNDIGIGLWCFIWMATGTSKTSGTFTNGTWAANATTNRLSSNTVNFADSTDNECFITGVQLEVGTVATPFEHRSYGQELALCQRYYAKTYDQGTVPGTSTRNGCIASTAETTHAYASAGTWQFPVTMREAPTILLYSTETGTLGQIAADVTDGAGVADNISDRNAFIHRNNSSSGVVQNAYIRVQATASAEL